MALLQVSINSILQNAVNLRLCVDGYLFFRTYTQSLMHCYEVIPEGAVCKLYFDLEFHKPSNKGADGKTMVSSLIQVGYFSLTMYVPAFCSNLFLSNSLLHIQITMIQKLISLIIIETKMWHKKINPSQPVYISLMFF